MIPLERAARALFWSRGGGNWLQASQVEKDGWIKSARSMLEEIREPSNVMLVAGASIRTSPDRFKNGDTTLKPEFTAMIDALLD